MKIEEKCSVTKSCQQDGDITCFYGTAYIRVGSSRTTLVKHPDKERAIWNRRTDWSSEICEQATLSDLDQDAMRKAREQFKIKHPKKISEVDTWDEQTFLNKAKLTIHGAITNAALILLGKPEASSLLSPAVVKISWILKDGLNRELDYEHFGPPFILLTELSRKEVITNIGYRGQSQWIPGNNRASS